MTDTSIPQPDRLVLGGMTLTHTPGGVDISASTSPVSIRLQAADLPDIIEFLDRTPRGYTY